MAKTAAIDAFREAAERAYRKAYEGFSYRAQATGCIINPGFNAECFEAHSQKDANTGAHSLHVHGALRLDRFPLCRSEAPRKPQDQGISVLVLSHDVYRFRTTKPSKETCHLSTSEVMIGYYRRANNNYFNTIAALRYDFSIRGARHAHPVFHAQLERGKPRDDRAGLLTDINVVELPQNSYFPHMRIPTANMTGPMALLKLSADHLNQKQFSEVLMTYRKLPFFRDWACDLRSLDKAYPTPLLCASTWYSSQS